MPKKKNPSTKEGAFIPAPGPLRDEFNHVFRGSKEKVQTVIKKEEPSEEPLSVKGRFYVEDSIDIEDSSPDVNYDLLKQGVQIKKEGESSSRERATEFLSNTASSSVPPIKKEPVSDDDDDCVILEVCNPKVKSEFVDLDVESVGSTVPNSPNSDGNIEDRSTVALLTKASAILSDASASIKSEPLNKESPVKVKTELSENSLNNTLSFSPLSVVQLSESPKPPLLNYLKSAESPTFSKLNSPVRHELSNESTRICEEPICPVKVSSNIQVKTENSLNNTLSISPLSVQSSESPKPPLLNYLKSAESPTFSKLNSPVRHELSIESTRICEEPISCPVKVSSNIPVKTENSLNNTLSNSPLSVQSSESPKPPLLNYLKSAESPTFSRLNSPVKYEQRNESTRMCEESNNPVFSKLSTTSLLPFLDENFKIVKEELLKVLAHLNWMNVKSVEKKDELQKSDQFFASRGTQISSQCSNSSKKKKVKCLSEESIPAELFCNNTSTSVSVGFLEQFFSQGTIQHVQKVPLKDSSETITPEFFSQMTIQSANKISVSNFETGRSVASLNTEENLPSNQNTKLISYPTGHVPMNINPVSFELTDTSSERSFPELFSPGATSKISNSSFECDSHTPLNKNAVDRNLPSNPNTDAFISHEVPMDISPIKDDFLETSSPQALVTNPIISSLDSPLQVLSTAELRDMIEKANNSANNIKKRPDPEADLALPFPKRGKLNVNAESFADPRLKAPINTRKENRLNSRPNHNNFNTKNVEKVPRIPGHVSDAEPILNELQSSGPRKLNLEDYRKKKLNSSVADPQARDRISIPTDAVLVNNSLPHLLPPDQNSQAFTEKAGNKRYKNLLPKSVWSNIGVDFIGLTNVHLTFLDWCVVKMHKVYCQRQTLLFGAGKKPQMVRNNYHDKKDHYNTYFLLLLTELFFQVFQSYDKEANPFCICQLTSWKDGIVRVEISDTNKQLFNDQIVLLRICETDGGSTTIFGTVSKCQYNRKSGVSEVNFSTAYDRLVGLKRIEARCLCPGKWFFEQHLALWRLSYSPLFAQILKPQIHNIHCFPLSGSAVLRSVSEVLKSNVPSIVLLETSPEVSTVEKVFRLITSIKGKLLVCAKTKEFLIAIGLALINTKPFDVAIINRLRNLNLPKKLADRSLDHLAGRPSSIPSILGDTTFLLALVNHCYHDDLQKYFESRLEGISLTACLLMEANLCTEPESLVPLLYGVPHFILVGDPHVPCQPVSKLAERCNYGKSLFHRLQLHAGNS